MKFMSQINGTYWLLHFNGHIEMTTNDSIINVEKKEERE